MKKLIYILLFLFPVVGFSQQPWYKYSPMDYAWKNVGNAGFSTGIAQWTNLAFSPSGELYVAFEEIENDWDLGPSVMKFDGTNWVNVGNEGFSDGAQYLSLAISPSDNEPYVSFEETGLLYENASVMKFNGTNWVYVGNEGFSLGVVQYTSLAFSPGGELYVSYEDYGRPDSASSSGASVMKFDGTNWDYVGNRCFSASYADYESLAFGSSGEPYLAYTDWGYGGAITVMKFDGTNWVNIGNAGFSAGISYYTSLAFSPTGEPYVAYQDCVNHYKATVMKYDGTQWVNVGNEDFSVGPAYYTSLAFSPSDGQPYVAYEDTVNSWKATVMRFDGNQWIVVGNAGFSAGGANFTSIAFSLSGEPYVVYEDWMNSQATTVMKYDSVMVGVNERQKSKFSLYPNPATDKITIEIAEGQAPIQLSMMNLNGKKVLTRSLIKPKTQIDIGNLPSGVYFVRLTNDKTVEVGKFVKQ